MMKSNKFLKVVLTAAVALLTQGALAQTTTTLNFDSISDEVPVTNQYQAQGVVVNGATASNAANLAFVAHSGTQVAYAPGGLMTFSLSIADVKTVSAYVTGPVDVGIYAYDASNNLVGQSLLPANAPANTLLSVTTSGLPIAKVEIHDGGASFAIDDISFTTAAPVPQVPSCRAASESLYNLIYAVPASAYVRPKTQALDRVRLLAEVVAYEKLRASGKASQKVLQAGLAVIKADVNYSIKSTNTSAILSQISLMSGYVANNSCQ